MENLRFQELAVCFLNSEIVGDTLQQLFYSQELDTIVFNF